MDRGVFPSYKSMFALNNPLALKRTFRPFSKPEAFSCSILVRSLKNGESLAIYKTPQVKYLQNKAVEYVARCTTQRVQKVSYTK